MRPRRHHSTASISYFLTLPKASSGDLSLFQGFGYSSFSFTSVLYTMVSWPAGLHQMFLGRRKLLGARLQGLDCLQVQFLEIQALTADAVQRFTVLISMPETFEETGHFARNSPYPVLHVTSDRQPKVLHYSKVTSRLLHDYCLKVIGHLKVAGVQFLTPGLPRKLPVTKRVPIAFNIYGHNVTRPNELAVESLGLIGQTAASPVGEPAEDLDAPYRQIVLETARSIRLLRRQITKKADAFGAVDLILTAPSVVAEELAGDLATSLDAKDCEPETFRLAISQILRQTNYPQFVGDATRIGGIGLSDQARRLTVIRRWELDLYTAILGVRAAKYFCPVVRLWA